MSIGGVGNAKSEGELSNFHFGYVLTSPNTLLGSTVNMTSITLKDKGAISKNRENVDPRTRPENRRGVPNSVASNILG